ncbi:hypothetical protein GGR52DRAFT_58258 [Hypoxylon sp. FL1284]|nr:hypothetical protein GGR52DRAFT_58258 [Hypoxylon sp. FL1284]
MGKKVIKPDDLVGTSVPKPRIPLANTANTDASKHTDVSKRTDVKKKWDRKDSSEKQPSSRDSIYDAVGVSDTKNSVAKPSSMMPNQQVSAVPTTTAAARPATPAPTSARSESSMSQIEAVSLPAARTTTTTSHFLYGRGTGLEPIKERVSITHLRMGPLDKLDKSASREAESLTAVGGIGNNAGNASNDSNGSLSTKAIPERLLRRCKSFNWDEHEVVAFVVRRTKDTSTGSGSGIRTGTSSSGTGPDVMVGVPRLRHTTTRHYAPTSRDVLSFAQYPQTPVYPAHQRPPDPIGFPEQLALHQQQHVGGVDSQQHPTVVYSDEMQAPQFRGVRSAHGNLERHPYMRQPAVMENVGGPVTTAATTATTTAAHHAATAAVAAHAADVHSVATTTAAVHGAAALGAAVHGAVAHNATRSRRQQQTVAVREQQQQQQQFPWICWECGQPNRQRLNLVGRRPRHSDDICSRCVWSKRMFKWFCCTDIGGHL